MAGKFVAEHGEGDATPPQSGETRAPAAPRPHAAGSADKMRGHADSMQAKIDDCFRDRDTNTHRKARMAAGARIDGTQWERAQRIARALADTHDASAVPAVLARVATKAELFELANEETAHCGGYYDAPRLPRRPSAWRAVAKNAQGAG